MVRRRNNRAGASSASYFGREVSPSICTGETAPITTRQEDTPTQVRPVSAAKELVLEEENKGAVRRIIDIPGYNLIVVSRLDSELIEIYRYETRTEPNATARVRIRKFQNHSGVICGLVNLAEDVMASCDKQGVILTWRARSGKVLGRSDTSANTGALCMVKLTQREFAVATDDGKIQIVHIPKNMPTFLLEEHVLKNQAIAANQSLRMAAYETRDTSIDTHIHGDGDGEGANHQDAILLAISNKFTNSNQLIHIWNYATARFIRTIRHPNTVGDVVVSSKYIVTCSSWNIFVRQKTESTGFQLVATIPIHNNAGPYPMSLSLIDERNMLMVKTREQGITLISLDSLEIITTFLSHISLSAATVLEDGRIGIGCTSGYCAIYRLPQKIEDLIKSKHPVENRVSFGTDRIVVKSEDMLDKENEGIRVRALEEDPQDNNNHINISGAAAGENEGRFQRLDVSRNAAGLKNMKLQVDMHSKNIEKQQAHLKRMEAVIRRMDEKHQSLAHQHLEVKKELELVNTQLENLTKDAPGEKELELMNTKLEKVTKDVQIMKDVVGGVLFDANVDRAKKKRRKSNP